MSILDIRAFCQCDGCGVHMTISVDPAQKTSEILPSVFDLVEDNVRGGVGCRDHDGCTSVQGGKMLCPRCTKKCDSFTDEDRDLTPAEIEEALAS